MSAWLADYELEACVATAAAKHGRALDAEDFLYEVVEDAMSALHPTQPSDDLSFFSVSDLTEEDRKKLLELGGFDVSSPENLAVITAMPPHTIISDGTARHIADNTLGNLLGPATDYADFQLFARTGAIADQLKEQVAELRHQARGTLQEDLERLEKYLETAPSRGPQNGWEQLSVPDWVDQSPSADYLKATDSARPELGV